MKIEEMTPHELRERILELTHRIEMPGISESLRRAYKQELEDCRNRLIELYEDNTMDDNDFFL